MRTSRIKKQLDEIHIKLISDPLNPTIHKEEELLTEQFNHWLSL